MKRLLYPFVGLLLSVAPLWAAMTDSKAMTEARKLWGPLAMISSVRDVTAANWTRQIGIKSETCANKFTVFGTGFNTWDAAFANHAANPPNVAGPFSGNVTMEQEAFDNIAIIGAQFYADDKPIGLSVVALPQQTVIWNAVLDTTMLTPGLHVRCFQAWDAAGNYGFSQARLFSVDQAAPPSTTPWRLQPPVLGTTIPK